jgi:hypothetical protein
MAVVWTEEMIAGTTASGSFGESARLQRRWKIRVDDPLTSKISIASAPGVAYGAAHPSVAALKMMEWDVSMADDVGMMWILSATYYVPPRDRNPGNNGIPLDYWDGSGSTRTVPLFKDTSGTIITNSAGDPLEGLEKERNDFAYTLHKYYTTNAWASDAGTYSGAVNNAVWAGGAVKTWKAEFRSATMRTVYGIGANPGATNYVETVWEFRYEPDTWKCMPWDIGFAQRCDASGTPTQAGTQRKAILGQDNKPVKQPVGLENGVALAPGTPLVVINGGAGVDIYPTANFSTAFGSPFLL